MSVLLQGHCSGQHHAWVPPHPGAEWLQDALRPRHHLTTRPAAITLQVGTHSWTGPYRAATAPSCHPPGGSSHICCQVATQSVCTSSSTWGCASAAGLQGGRSKVSISRQEHLLQFTNSSCVLCS